VPERPSRQLVVVLHADVVGSTALVQKDEALAHERIRDGFLRLSNTIEAYRGNEAMPLSPNSKGHLTH